MPKEKLEPINVSLPTGLLAFVQRAAASSELYASWLRALGTSREKLIEAFRGMRLCCLFQGLKNRRRQVGGVEIDDLRRIT
jgi:hypothetical protein